MQLLFVELPGPPPPFSSLFKQTRPPTNSVYEWFRVWSATTDKASVPAHEMGDRRSTDAMMVEMAHRHVVRVVGSMPVTVSRRK